ncbi:MAG: hypothetical protein JJU00_01025 [Opitutales bacterium]|nr:hypothetical protein [Opitutales bacterium]
MKTTDKSESGGNWLTRRPWIFIIAFFILLTLGLAGMLTIAFKTFPGAVEPVRQDQSP